MKRILFVLGWLFSGLIYAQVSFDTSSSKVGTTGANSFSLTVAANSNRFLVVGFSMGSSAGAPTVNSVKWNGSETPTLIGSVNNSGADQSTVYIYGLVGPTATTANVDFNTTSSGGVICGAASFYGVNQSTPTSGFNSTTNTSGTQSISISSQSSNSMVFAVDAIWNAITTNGSQVQDWNGNATSMSGAGSHKAGTGGSVTMSYTSASGNWAIAGMSINPPVSRRRAHVSWLMGASELLAFLKGE